MATVGLDLSTTLNTRRPLARVRSRKLILGSFVCALLAPDAATINAKTANFRIKGRRILGSCSSEIAQPPSITSSPFGRGRGRGTELTYALAPHPNPLPKGEGKSSIQIQRIAINLVLVLFRALHCLLKLFFQQATAILVRAQLLREYLFARPFLLF